MDLHHLLLAGLPAHSALPPKADSSRTSGHVRFVPCVDGSGLARTFFTLQTGSVLPCVRPVGAVHMTAGHNALRGSGPGHVWTAPSWQGLSSRCSVGRCSHV